MSGDIAAELYVHTPMFPLKKLSSFKSFLEKNEGKNCDQILSEIEASHLIKLNLQKELTDKLSTLSVDNPKQNEEYNKIYNEISPLKRETYYFETLRKIYEDMCKKRDSYKDPNTTQIYKDPKDILNVYNSKKTVLIDSPSEITSDIPANSSSSETRQPESAIGGKKKSNKKRRTAKKSRKARKARKSRRIKK